MHKIIVIIVIIKINIIYTLNIIRITWTLTNRNYTYNISILIHNTIRICTTLDMFCRRACVNPAYLIGCIRYLNLCIPCILIFLCRFLRLRSICRCINRIKIKGNCTFVCLILPIICYNFNSQTSSRHSHIIKTLLSRIRI